jgi:hypothetical protein
MADIRKVQVAPPVEADGISYSGIVWFVVILVITTLVCQFLMVVMFKAMEHQQQAADAAAPPTPLARMVNTDDSPAPRAACIPTWWRLGRRTVRRPRCSCANRSTSRRCAPSCTKN